MAQVATDVKEQAHALIDRLAPGQLAVVVDLLRVMADPVSRAIAEAPYDDEPVSEEEARSVAESRAWMAEHPGEGIPFEEVLAEYGLTTADLKGELK
jgi:hypothetical protein